MPEKRQSSSEPLDDELDHVRGGTGGRLVLEYGDYECPYSREAFLEIQRVGQGLGGGFRLAFRHFKILGTPTLFIDGVVHRGRYDTATLMEVLAV
ncbi:MAG: hypothetical protein QOD65_1044 [Gaiellales bacterium]|nr:hypothetical protein [Gaiellales bacterium]